RTLMDWQVAPPPLRRPAARGASPFAVPEEPPEPAAPPEEPEATDADSGNGAAAQFVAIPVLAAEPAAPGRDKGDPASASARPRRAGRGRGTKRALYHRLAGTRRLARGWEAAGKYLAWPKRRVTKPAEATELIELLAAVRTALRGFPPLL